MQLSASSAALDLALSQSPGPDASANGWGAFNRHRHSQQSLPMNTLHGSTPASQANKPTSPISVRPSYRHSLDLNFFEGQQDTSSQVNSPTSHAQATPPKLQSSYSANDVPTMRSAANSISGVNNNPNSHAQQHLHNHNASLGRIPPNAVNNRLSRDLNNNGDNPSLRDAQNNGYQSIQSALQASAAPFGPALTQGLPQAPLTTSMTASAPQQQYPAPAPVPGSAPGGVPGYYNNYNMQMMTMGVQNMHMGQPVYTPQNPYNSYGTMYQQAPLRDSQARVIQQRRQNDGEGRQFTRL
jgi:hypothetical protein